MNMTELVDALSAATGMTKAESKRAIHALFDTDDGVIARALKKGERVQITGFGTFDTKRRKARMGRNPRSGETIQIAAARVPSFRPGQPLKDAQGGSGLPIEKRSK